MFKTIEEQIGASPLSTIDVDAIVVAGRRRTRLRRLAAVGSTTAAATAVVATLALTVSALGTPGQPSAPTVVPPAAQPAGPDGAAPVHAGETPEQTTQRLAAALTDALTAALPGVVLTEWFGGQPGVLVNYEGKPDRYNAGTVLTVEAGQNQVDFQSWPGGVLPPPMTVTSSPPDAWFESCEDVTDPRHSQLECTDSIGPDGQKIVAFTVLCGPDDECPVGMVSSYRVYVTWTNARVELSIAAATKRGGPADPPAPPLLTLEQVIAVAVDPGLTVAL